MNHIHSRALPIALVFAACNGAHTSSTTLADPPPATSENAAACSGSGARLSIMPIGDADCKVTVGGTSMGLAPFANKPAPVGKCDIQVTCPSGREYKTTRKLKAGVLEKVVLKTRDLEP